jgi:hypothetical protein
MSEGRALRIYITLFETWQRKSTIEALTPRWVNQTPSNLVAAGGLEPPTCGL